MPTAPHQRPPAVNRSLRGLPPPPLPRQCLVYAAAGLPPDWLLPVAVDVGTENDELRDRDPLYVGLQQRRVRGDAYFAIMEVRKEWAAGAGRGGVARAGLGTAVGSASGSKAQGLLGCMRRRLRCL
jgi:hypothetical protein